MDESKGKKYKVLSKDSKIGMSPFYIEGDREIDSINFEAFTYEG